MINESVGQPCAYREVVDLDAGLRHGDGGDEYAYRHPDVGAERRVDMSRGPIHLYVYHGIMCDIQRV